MINIFFPILIFLNNYYIAYLKIPKIDFNRGLYSKYSINNNIEKNIAFHPESEMPNNNSNTIIMGHSGLSSISYFEDLKELEKNDSIYFYYNNIQYEFIIDSIYIVKKDGILDIIRNDKKMTLTLITCYLDNYQLVVIAYKK